jgi:hypothetical protein
VGAFAAALAPFAAAETQALISAIQRIERAASGERPMVRMLTPLTQQAVTVQLPPPRPPWGIYASALFAGSAIAGITWGIAQRSDNNVNDVDGGVDAGAIVINVVTPSAVPVVSAPPVPSATPSSAPVASVSASAPIASVSAGPLSRPPAIPTQCRRGELDYMLPSGMRKLCPR